MNEIERKDFQKLILGTFESLLKSSTDSIERVNTTEVNGLTVSTVNTTDMGYETAIIDIKGVYPVERYELKEDAEIGHLYWCDQAKTMTQVTMLGYGSLLPPEEKVSLSRKTI